MLESHARGYPRVIRKKIPTCMNHRGSITNKRSSKKYMGAKRFDWIFSPFNLYPLCESRGWIPPPGERVIVRFLEDNDTPRLFDTRSDHFRRSIDLPDHAEYVHHRTLWGKSGLRWSPPVLLMQRCCSFPPASTT